MLDLCTSPGGDCTCPPGSDPLGNSPQTAPPELRLAATGEERATTVLTVQGISMDDWCRTKRTDLCKDSCGGSNGDPHMRTVDGVRYDLQSAGEYVLLRSADGSIEIQGRQERPPRGRQRDHRHGGRGSASTGTGSASTSRRSGPPQVHVDGAALERRRRRLDRPGRGAKLTPYQRGYELDLPDGTEALGAVRWAGGGSTSSCCRRTRCAPPVSG